MKAAILKQSNKPLIVDDVQLPGVLDYGQVHVKLFYSGICGAQINEIDAVKGPDKYLPHLLGHEGSGKVVKIGPGVTTLKEGDHFSSEKAVIDKITSKGVIVIDKNNQEYFFEFMKKGVKLY